MVQGKVANLVKTEHGSELGNRSTVASNRTLLILVTFVVVALLGMIGGVVFNYIHGRAQDNVRKQDLSYIASLNETYFNLYHDYPTLRVINSSTLSLLVQGGVDRQKFKDPSSNGTILLSYPSPVAYAYEVMPVGCDNQKVLCEQFKLVAILSSGKDYTVHSKAVS